MALALSLTAAAVSFVAAASALLKKILELRKLQQLPGQDAEAAASATATATAPPCGSPTVGSPSVRFEAGGDQVYFTLPATPDDSLPLTSTSPQAV